MTIKELLLDRDHMLPLLGGVVFYCVLYFIRLNGFINAQGRFPSWKEYREYQGGEFARALRWLRYFCYFLFILFAFSTWLKLG